MMDEQPQGMPARSQTTWVAFVAISTAIAAGYYGWRAAGSNSPPAETVELVTLLDTYDRNEVAGDLRYKDKRVRVTGIVRNLGRSLGDPFVELAPLTGYTASNAQLEFQERSASVVAGTAVGAQLSASCTVRGRGIITIRLVDCE